LDENATALVIYWFRTAQWAWELNLKGAVVDDLAVYWSKSVSPAFYYQALGNGDRYSMVTGGAVPDACQHEGKAMAALPRLDWE
jgi:hypothetical protein